MAVIPGSRAHAKGVWNVAEGSYQDDLADASDLELVQGLTATVYNFATVMSIPPSVWYWHQPSGMDGATNELFSSLTSATKFVEIYTDTTTGAATDKVERIKLLQKWFSAKTDMEWESHCPSLPHSASNDKCLIFPFREMNPALGARSDEVMLVQDVGRFNDSVTTTGTSNFVSLTFSQYDYRTFIEAGQNYNVTWFIRSPGQHSDPGRWNTGDANASHYNNLLVGFYMYFSFKNDMGLETKDSMGGATDPLNCSKPPNNCLAQNVGCTPHVLVNGSEPGGYPLYLNNGAWDENAPFTPYSFSFTPGAINVGGVPDIWHSVGCDREKSSEMNFDLCYKKETPKGSQGYWEFRLTTEGKGDGKNIAHTAGECDGNDARASASLFIDGMMLTAGSGTYTSKIYNSLSPKTVWKKIEVNMSRNSDPATGLPRTPVKLRWRVGDSTESWRSGKTMNDFMFNLDPALPDPSLVIVPSTATSETLVWTMTITMPGQYFQYQAELDTRDNNLFNPPGKNPYIDSFDCLRFSVTYDGTVNPRLNGVTVCYSTETGLFVSREIRPVRLNKWKSLTYQSTDSGGKITVDVTDVSGNVAVTMDGIALAGVTSLTSLARLDPGLYPAIKLRVVLERQGNSKADPRFDWFRVDYESTREILAVNRNVIRLSGGEEVAIRFGTGRTGIVEVKVYDASGTLIRRLFRGELLAGEVCQKMWNGTSDRSIPPEVPGCGGIDSGLPGSRVAPGVYFITVITPQGRRTVRVAVAR